MDILFRFEMPHPSGHAEETAGCMSLKFRRGVYAGDINLGAFHVSLKL